MRCPKCDGDTEYRAGSIHPRCQCERKALGPSDAAACSPSSEIRAKIIAWESVKMQRGKPTCPCGFEGRTRTIRPHRSTCEVWKALCCRSRWSGGDEYECEGTPTVVINPPDRTPASMVCECENPGPHMKPGAGGKFCAVCGWDIQPNDSAVATAPSDSD